MEIQEFRALVEKQQMESLLKRHPDYPLDMANHSCHVTVTPGKKYIKIDVGTSGKFMLDAEGNIFGIKGYGVIHRGHRYGTLDTVNDWFWGEYHPVKIKA